MEDKDVRLLSLLEYMEGRRKEIDRYVEGEHKWFGNVDSSTTIEHSMMYPSPKRWYERDTQVV